MKPELEHVPLDQKQSILAFRYENEFFDAPWHFHPQHELTFIEKSSGTKFIGDYVGPYESGELVLVSSNLPHCWKNTFKKGKKAKSIVVQWKSNVFNHAPELNAVFNMLNDASRGIIFKNSHVKKVLDSIHDILNLSGSALYLKLLNILITLSDCSYVTLSKHSFALNPQNKVHDRMYKIHEFIDLNYGRKLTLKEFAIIVDMSEQSFSRFFTKTMGRSVFVFLNEYRINMACRLLIDTDLSISEIGYRSGFESLTFFYKKFKKIKDISPSSYRKQFKSRKQ